MEPDVAIQSGPQHRELRVCPGTVRTVKVCVVFLDTHTPEFELYVRLRERRQGAVTRVERQLDLSSVAARLRGGLVLFVRVKESRRVHVPLLVPVGIIVESGPHHQQSNTRVIDIPCEALARLREAES
ncbi:hypothetical protein Taro_024322 [Colocasia esculenta]|uniref:Uncharacterized protein n=1 Tax=Colocasia esculenta TaxID=4460 RepID=A0A843V912_COLES|nr:hypothetical protein [Colocasia esculenta]